MKPLIRWTVGDAVSVDGLICLVESIKNIKKQYKDQFDLFVCHNGDNINYLKKKLDVEFIDQRLYLNSLSIRPKQTSWKLYPPRLRQNSHEIFIDNDIVIYKKHPILEYFLSCDNMFFCTQAAYRRYGAYNSSIKSSINLNTGFFGIPPFFDFAKEIQFKIIGDWNGWFDEQGLVSSILLEKNISIIPLDEIWVCCDFFVWGKYGIHFVGLNNSKNIFWTQYNKSKVKLL